MFLLLHPFPSPPCPLRLLRLRGLSGSIRAELLRPPLPGEVVLRRFRDVLAVLRRWRDASDVLRRFLGASVVLRSL
jgi:hypothetical protein